MTDVHIENTMLNCVVTCYRSSKVDTRYHLNAILEGNNKDLYLLMSLVIKYVHKKLTNFLMYNTYFR